MPKCLIFDSDNENSDNDDSLDYSNYREVSLNDIKSNLNRKTSQWCKQYTNIKITSEIKKKKVFILAQYLILQIMVKVLNVNV